MKPGLRATLLTLPADPEPLPHPGARPSFWLAPAHPWRHPSFRSRSKLSGTQSNLEWRGVDIAARNGHELSMKKTNRNRSRHRAPTPPSGELPLVHASAEVARWLQIYWQKLRIPASQAYFLAVTDSRQEFARWTGRRLNSFALGCYCYLPLSGQLAAGAEAHIDYDGSRASTLSAPTGSRAPMILHSPSLWDDANTPSERLITPSGLASEYRHLIFIEPTLLPASAEVTVAHELIHLRDRVQGQPRRHRCHGNDAISLDEALITGRDPEALRVQLREETDRREAALRSVRPYRYLYRCPNCEKEYYRVRKYGRATSCGRCDSRFNPNFELRLESTLGGSETDLHP
jgi:hypothetical protein